MKIYKVSQFFTEEQKPTRKVESEMHKLEKEGGYGWVVTFSLFIEYVVNTGIQSCSGIIHLEIYKTTHANLSQIVWIGSVLIGFSFLLAPVTAILTKQIPCRVLIVMGNVIASLGFLVGFFSTSIPVLILCIGVLPGLGFGLMIIPLNLVLNTYFERRLPLAYGIGLSGAGIGFLAMPPFFVFLVDVVGIQGCFLITSGILLNCVVFALLCKPYTTTTSSTKGGEKTEFSVRDLYDFSLFKSYKFMLFVFANVFTNGGNAMPLTFLPLKGDEEGFSEESSALLISLLGVGGALARVIFGSLFTRKPRLRQPVYLSGVILAAVSMLTTGFVDSYEIIAVCSFIFGACAGVIHTEIPALLTSLYGIDRLPCSFGISNLTHGIGALIGVPVAELICKAVNDNNAAFTVTCASSTIGFILLSIVFYGPETRRERKNSENTTIDDNVEISVINVKPLDYQKAA